MQPVEERLFGLQGLADILHIVSSIDGLRLLCLLVEPRYLVPLSGPYQLKMIMFNLIRGFKLYPTRTQVWGLGVGFRKRKHRTGSRTSGTSPFQDSLRAQCGQEVSVGIGLNQAAITKTRERPDMELHVKQRALLPQGSDAAREIFDPLGASGGVCKDSDKPETLDPKPFKSLIRHRRVREWPQNPAHMPRSSPRVLEPSPSSQEPKKPMTKQRPRPTPRDKTPWKANGQTLRGHPVHA